MKVILTTILISFVLPIAVIAQKPKVENDPAHDDKPIHFGFSLGLNTMDYTIELDEYAKTNNVYVGLKKLQPGVNIHAITNLRLAENFDLRALPGISFGERYMYFVILSNPDSVLNDGKFFKLSPSYLELPISLKYKSKRLNNFRPYLIGGANFRYDLAVKGEYDSDQIIIIKKPDVFAEIGYGMDFYLTYFKFGVELKYSIGLTNIMKKVDTDGKPPEPQFEIYTNSIKSITSHMVVLSFHFE